jgi:Fungal specific transcription factor domain
VYVGDSATLSFLQLLRMMVENVAGPSTFTNDPQRHKIVEGQFSLQSSGRHTHLLPNKRTAVVLVDAFFINTHGFLQVFERQIFLGELERCYSDPLSTEPSWLCLLNLVFAIGLMLATPRPGGNESVTIEKLRSERLDRAEVFYLNAKSLNDPMTGFEDADFWSVQALLLMSVYMLAKSKRNTAFALLGMAVRSAYALGLHREETMVIFSPDEQAARRNLWRSLFVVDRFLSCSLGRPTAISEDDCSGDTLRPPNSHGDTDAFGFNATFPSTSTFNQTSAFALEAAVRSCSVIGKILKRVYQQRKISTRLAQEIADICKLWPKALAPSLHWRQAATASPSQGIAILHVNLFYCHSIILLTRPFFLFIVNAEAQKDVTQSMTGVRPGRNYSRMEKFSEACVIASTHTIVLVQNAFEAGYLPRRNPTVIYFLFAATLVILANEFASLYTSLTADQCILNAVAVMAYCAEGDQQASRLLYILSTFRDAVAAQLARKNRSHTGMMGMGSIPAQMYATSQQQPHISSPLHTTHQPSLHQTPVHVYPDLHRSPYLNTDYAAQTRHAPSSHPDHAQIPAPLQQPSASIISPQSTAGNPPDLAFNPAFSRPISLSNVLDLSAFDAARAPSLHSEESSGPDEDIDFDALWAWPSSTPALGSPRFGADAAAGVQGASESAVPLFAVISGNERPRGKTSGGVTS